MGQRRSRTTDYKTTDLGRGFYKRKQTSGKAKG
jgi:hypothetical protein